MLSSDLDCTILLHMCEHKPTQSKETETDLDMAGMLELSDHKFRNKECL